MKELSIEQKAKAYDEAVKKAESLYKVSEPMSGCNVIIETLFPELKESEDERIRKALIEYFNEQCDMSDWNGVYGYQVVAWLEKQGKHANFRNKIQIGDKVTRNQDGMLVNLSQLNRVAKDEKQGEQNPVIPKFRVGDIVMFGGYRDKSTITEIDFNNKRYNIAEDKERCILFSEQDKWELVEQKPVEIVKWSPQEESCICQLESLVKEQWRHAEKVHNSINIKKMSELMFFLKTLNPNKKPQRIVSAEAKEAMYDKPAWSEEDGKNLRVVVDYLIADNGLSLKYINWLNFLKYRVIPQSKQEWSEEDNQYLCGLIGLIEQSKAGLPITLKGKAADNCIDWLKSLRPQKQWKPSEEQMKALKEACDEHWELDGLDPLYTLYEQLKAL